MTTEATAPEQEDRPSRVRTTSFGPLQICYDDSVLEPRGWTALQSTWAAELLVDLPPGRVLELCSGAGQIGLLALHLSGRTGVLVDASPIACAWARHNARANDLAARVEIREGDVSHTLGATEYFPLVIIDPPWVPTDKVGTFPEDPVRSIDGGSDGLDVARRCLAVAASHLTPEGSALLQLGSTAQAQALAEWFDGPRSLPFRVDEVRPHEDRGVLVALSRS